MAMAPKAFKTGELQDAIDTEIVTHRKKYTDVVLSDAIYSNFTSFRWGCISGDSMLTGFLGNLYFFGEVDLEKQQAINHKVELMYDHRCLTERRGKSRCKNGRNIQISYSIYDTLGTPQR